MSSEVRASEIYDEYWRGRDLERSRARSIARARLAIDLLARSGLPARPSTTGAEIGPTALLDVGCGPGWALEEFVRAGFRARGLEVSAVAVAMARERGLDVASGDLATNAGSERQDVVVALEVLEHVVDPLAMLRSMSALVRPGGVLVISLPNEFHALRRIAIALGIVRGWAGHDDPHIRHFDRASAERLFRAAGLRVAGRRSEDLIPPRFARTKRVIGPLLAALPGLFAISDVWLVRVDPNAPAADAESERDAGEVTRH